MESFVNNKNIYRSLVLLACAVVCVSIFFPFLTTIALAGIFAMVLNPAVVRMQKLRFRKFSVKCRKKCSAILLLFLIVVFIIPFSIMGSRVYSQIQEFSGSEGARKQFVSRFSNYVTVFESQLSAYINKMGLRHRISAEAISGGITQRTANFFADSFARAITQLPGFLVEVLIFLVALYYMLAESEKLGGFLRSLGVFSSREIILVRESLKVSCHAAVVSTVMAGLIHGFIVALGSQIVGVGDFSLVFILTFFLSFIPVIGAAIVALSLCVPALMAQNYSGAASLLGIALFASAVDNLVRPLFLVYGNHLVHPFISLLSVLGGIALFGMAGLFIGPVLVQVTFDVFPKFVRLDFKRDLQIPVSLPAIKTYHLKGARNEQVFK